MSKAPNLTNISIGPAQTALNNNFDRIEEAFNNTLSRDGSTPNQMEADLDLNSNDLLNVGTTDTARLFVAGEEITGLLSPSIQDEVYASYDEALAAYKPDYLIKIGAVVQNQIIEWVRQSGGPCLGGGWVPACDITPEHFGAVGDGVTDDAPALTEMMLYVGTLPSASVVIRSSHYCSTSLSVTSNGLSIVFENPRISSLIFNGTDGLAITQTSRYANLYMMMPTLVTKGEGLGAGLSYTNTVSSTGESGLKRIVSPTLMGWDMWNSGGAGDDEWGTALSLNNADRMVVEQPLIRGAQNQMINNFPKTTVGILADGCTQLHINSPAIFVQHYGVRLQGQSEGLEFDGGTVVACKRGFEMLSSTPPNNDINIRGTHFASFDYNIDMNSGGSATVMGSIEGCLLFTRTEATVSSSFTHIIANGQMQVLGNNFFTGAGVDGSGHTAVQVMSGKGTQIMNNIMTRVGALANIAAAASHTQVFGNMISDDGITIAGPLIVDAGSNTRSHNNLGDRAVGRAYAGLATWSTGAGSPLGVVVAYPGSIYTDTATGTLYRKTSGTGTGGWVTP